MEVTFLCRSTYSTKLMRLDQNTKFQLRRYRKIKNCIINRDYFVVGDRVRFLFTCELLQAY